jgi:hypothetical protein
MTDPGQYKFWLNQYFYGKEGISMNVNEIRQARNEAAKQIQQILRKLEMDTGLTVSYVGIESGRDNTGNSTGVTDVEIDLELN